GTDYPTEDGTAVRDYIHVEDLGRAHLLAMDAIAPRVHTISNPGNGLGFSVRQVIEAARKVTGREIPVREEPRRPGDPAQLVASSEKIRAELGWEPRSHRARGNRGRAQGDGAGDPRQGGAAPPGRPRAARRVEREDPRRARLGA